ncbi:MAG: UDPglucose 6-dehydrogenase [Arenicella sp.]|jgi:UDPglucose 6-dehydrogenase
MEKIGVIGVGRLGICLALNLEHAGYEVFAVDVSDKRIAEINAKRIEVEEPLVEEYLSQAKNLKASIELTSLLENKVQSIFICVPTPSLESGKFSHEFILQITDKLLKLPQPEQTVDLIINSTTMPGFCQELQNSLGKHKYRVSYNPEFIAQGNIIKDQQYPDQVLIGELSTEAGDRVEGIYHKMCPELKVVSRMSLTSAEISKLSVNCFLTTKIAFANAIGDLATEFGAEPDKILKAVGSDLRIGDAFLKYGFGYGGPCLPRDNRALGKVAEGKQIDLLLSKATDEANKNHLNYQLQQFLNENPSEPIIFNQVTYKPDIDIIEESQQLALAVELSKAGKKVKIIERKSVISQLKQKYPGLFEYEERSDV